MITPTGNGDVDGVRWRLSWIGADILDFGGMEERRRREDGL